jgi:hypothetical protein
MNAAFMPLLALLHELVDIVDGDDLDAGVDEGIDGFAAGDFGGGVWLTPNTSFLEPKHIQLSLCDWSCLLETSPVNLGASPVAFEPDGPIRKKDLNGCCHGGFGLKEMSASRRFLISNAQKFYSKTRAIPAMDGMIILDRGAVGQVSDAVDQ